MEADFVHFMDFVPYTNQNKAIYSPKLLAMILQICGYIDTVFKEMAKFKSIRKIPMCEKINSLERQNYRSYDITLARDAFETIYNLSINNGGKLIAKLDWVGDKELTPFSNFAQNRSPQWWYDYNNLKHNWASTIRRANMDNALEALAGAFLLNAVHYPSIRHLWKLGILKPIVKSGNEFAETYLPEKVFDDILKKSVSSLKSFNYSHMVETELFLYAKI